MEDICFIILANKVAKQLNIMAIDSGFNTFEEMKNHLMLSSRDIRKEICHAARKCGGDFRDKMKVIIAGSTGLYGFHEIEYLKFRDLVGGFYEYRK